MGFYVQDDYWEAVSELPRKTQDEVMGALVRLFFEGDDEPDIKGVSKALFVALRERVRLSAKKSGTRRDKAESEPRENPGEMSGSSMGSSGDDPGVDPRMKSGSSMGSSGDDPGVDPQDKPRVIRGSKSVLLNKREREREKEPKEKEPPKGGSKKKGFSPPSPEEVAAYAAERGDTRFNAERFCDFYASKGWKVGKSPMVDWRASVRGWMARDQEKGGVTDAELAEYAALV